MTNNNRLVLSLIILVAALWPVLPAQAQSPGGESATRRVLVARRGGPSTLRAAGAEPLLRNVPAGEARIIRQFENLPGAAVEATAAGVAALQQNPDLLVSEDLPVHAALAQSTAFIRADTARQVFGLSGAGVNVAVLDTGVDALHPDLAGRVVAQACFNHGSGCPVDGSAPDEQGHGTHVAGIIAGQGASGTPGMAPGAGLAAVRVLDAAGSGYTSDVLAGLDWVVSHGAELNIKIINLSLGGGSYSGVCDTADANTQLYAGAVAAARQAGMAVFAAAGNGGQAEKMLAPACVSGVVAVGNVYDSALGVMTWPGCTDSAVQPGQVACSSNGGAALDVLAPGTLIESSWPGGGTAIKSGTSMAAPHAAGTAALLLEASPEMTPDALESLLKSSGIPVTDPRNGRVTPRIDALAAVEQLIGSATVISGTVQLQGRTDFSGVQVFAASQPCDAAAFPAEPVAVTGPDGRFEIHAVSVPGCVRAVHAGYLVAQAGQPAGNLGTVILPAGDINGDAMVNILDLARIAAQYKQNDPAADVNASGVVDIFDLVFTAQNFNTQGPIPW